MSTSVQLRASTTAVILVDSGALVLLQFFPWWHVFCCVISASQTHHCVIFTRLNIIQKVAVVSVSVFINNWNILYYTTLYVMYLWRLHQYLNFRVGSYVCALRELGIEASEVPQSDAPVCVLSEAVHCDTPVVASALDGVVAVLATPPNSYSAVTDPIDLVCGRGGDLEMLEVSNIVLLLYLYVCTFLL